MAGVLEIQTGAMGLVVRYHLVADWRVHPRTFFALFNYLTPSGRVTVTGRVVEDTGQAERASEG
jgi:hypothetical protein